MQQRITEQRNSRSLNIDTMSTVEIIKLINQEDQQVPAIIGQPNVQDAIATIIDQIVLSFQNNGRLFYLGAGTSGRLGILDAAECVPTFGSAPEMIQGLIAGGSGALIKAVEGAEDSAELGANDLKEKQLAENDFVLGIAASGRTPYVIGGLDYAKSIGCQTGALSCNNNAIISRHATYAIEAVVGPEVITGSTRMKAGTAQKLILNTISTTAMIKLGKVYSNLMVDVQPTNLKLVDRAKRIIQDATDVDYKTATQFYNDAAGQPKVAIVMINGQVSRQQAEQILNANNGFISRALDSLIIN
ncbi:N-acetylmuramic acid 6-phosphate etherase [Lapidilactobacillus gannanensis]|uniref:N-acetylmuramic acid 6-phosphate etherase n=1 Tax=Lapidilactobacillus gannanensis TaxID=2486002 RepID=A0ABW4BQ20_9LACO|nr:N-acetylmuramic acid 6-phosphate etherase [Lapidilactobacillus gannanensis]